MTLVLETVGDLFKLADARARAGDLDGTLHAYAAVVQLQPTNLDARQRVADTLLAMNELQRAAVVNAAIARFASNAGYPLRALVSVKILAALDPQLHTLLHGLAELYASDSKRLGRSVRPSPGDRQQPLPKTIDLSTRPPHAELVAAAERVAADLTGALYPERLPPVPLLSDLPAEAFVSVLASVKLRRVQPGEVIIAEGEPGDAFYIVARGEVAVTRQRPSGERIELARLHDGALFGEMALVSAAPRTASVTAVADGDLLQFDRDALLAACQYVATLATALDKFTRERMLHNLLATNPLFAPLEVKQRFELIRRFTAHEVSTGVPLIREGEPGRGLFIVLAGEVDVTKVDGDSKVLLASLKPGDVFGEISLLHDEVATASVTSARPSTVLFLERAVFQKLIEAFPEIRAKLDELGEERSMDTRLLLEAGADEMMLDDDEVVLL